MVGFFGRCSNTGERVWYVITVPPLAAGMRPDRFGPIDDDEWAPETSALFEPASGQAKGFTYQRITWDK